MRQAFSRRYINKDRMRSDKAEVLIYMSQLFYSEALEQDRE